MYAQETFNEDIFEKCLVKLINSSFRDQTERKYCVKPRHTIQELIKDIEYAKDYCLRSFDEAHNW